VAREQVIPDPDLHYGRFKVLQRTDGKFVVHEKDQHSGPFRFGPVFATLPEACWRAWHRAAGEKLCGAQIGDGVRVAERSGFLVDFVAPLGVTDVRRIEAAVRTGSRVGMVPAAAVQKDGPARAALPDEERKSGKWQSQYQ
jgi:hypothetical protein